MKKIVAVLLAILLLIGMATPALAVSEAIEAQIFSMGAVREIAAGNRHTVAILHDGSLWAWGAGSRGQLGNGSLALHNTPVQVGTDTNWRNVAAGMEHTMAIRQDGTLWGWGTNAHGQLGDGTWLQRNTPVQIGTESNWRSVSTSGEHTVAIRTDGTLWAWGTNASGQLGDGTWQVRNTPQQIGTDTNWRSASAGGALRGAMATPPQSVTGHTIAVRTDGTLWAWGINANGQLGDGTWTVRNTPQRIGTDTNWSTVEAGMEHSMATRQDGTLWAWGRNSSGQLGDGTWQVRNTPQQVGTDANWSRVAAGTRHTLALRTDGTLWAWGHNGSLQLGDGSPNTRNAPVQIGEDTNWNRVAAGDRHSVATKTDGSLWAWGWNSSGQFGDGTLTNSNVPRLIIPPGDIPPGDLPFTDVNPGDWFYDAVRYVFQNNIMVGLSDTSFAPHTGLSRAMSATILYRLEGEPPVTFRPIFSDVAEDRWYSDAITWAYDAGVVEGVGGGRFDPTHPLTREQLTTMMHRLAGDSGYDLSVPDTVPVPEGTSAWAAEAMRWAVHNGFIGANNPRDAASRADTAVFVYRFHLRFGV